MEPPKAPRTSRPEKLPWEDFSGWNVLQPSPMKRNDLNHPSPGNYVPAVNLQGCTHLKTNMTMENPPFEDVSPIENGGFPILIRKLEMGWFRTQETTRPSLKALGLGP